MNVSVHILFQFSKIFARAYQPAESSHMAGKRQWWIGHGYSFCEKETKACDVEGACFIQVLIVHVVVSLVFGQVE